MTERRRHVRRRTLLDGRLGIPKLDGWSLTCTVRNLSETGARLVIPSDILVPCNVDLAVSHRVARPAELVWFRGGQAGFALRERRTAPRLAPANDSVPTAAPATRLAARIAAIAGREPGDRPHFTGI